MSRIKKFTILTLAFFVLGVAAMIADRYITSRFLTIGISAIFVVGTCFGIIAWKTKEGVAAIVLFSLNLILFLANTAKIAFFLSLVF